MIATSYRSPPGATHPLQAALLTCALPLFVGGLLGDIAYWRSQEIQWLNFAAWLVAGGMVFTGLSLAWTLVDLVRAGRPWASRAALALAVLAAFVVGLIDSFVHTRDAWATMPEGLVLSALLVVLALLCVGLGFSGLRRFGGSHEPR